MAQPPYVAVPEAALERRRQDKLSHGAWDLYEWYCKHRNRGDGRCDPSLKLLAQEMRRTYKHVSDCKAELVAKGWIRRCGRNAVELLVGGFEAPKVVRLDEAKSGKIRTSGEAGDAYGDAKSGKIRTSSPEKSGIGNASHINEPNKEPTDDDDTSSAELLAFYSEQTGNPVRASDRRAIAGMARHPPHVVKAGIVLSLLRARARINSLKYCSGAVSECAEAKSSEGYLKYLLSQLEKRRRQVQPALPGVGAEVVEGDFADEEQGSAGRRANGKVK